MGLGAVIYIDGEEQETYSHFVRSHELNSNNVAEYGSFMWLLHTLLEHDLNEKIIHIYGDSKLVVCQMSGLWKIKQGKYVETALECKALLKNFKNISLNWIPREENYYADELSKGELVKNNVEFKIQPINL